MYVCVCVCVCVSGELKFAWCKTIFKIRLWINGGYFGGFIAMQRHRFSECPVVLKMFTDMLS